MEINRNYYNKAFENTTTWYQKSEDDPDMWESFKMLNKDATDEQKAAYVQCYVEILGQGDDKQGLKEFKKAYKRCAEGIKSKKWVSQDEYDRLWAEANPEN